MELSVQFRKDSDLQIRFISLSAHSLCLPIAHSWPNKQAFRFEQAYFSQQSTWPRNDRPMVGGGHVAFAGASEALPLSRDTADATDA